MKQCLNPSYDRLASFVARLPERFAHEGRVIYKERNEIRVFEEASDLPINAKRYKVPIWINRVIYSFFRKSKAQRAYEYAFELERRGFSTAAPIAYLLFYRGGLLHESYFISKQLNARPIYTWIQLSTVEAEPYYRALGRYVGQLHQAGIYHADLSPGNILFEWIDGQARFYLIDINRMRFGKVSFRQGCANFARIWGNKQSFIWMAESYAEQTGADPAKSIRLILQERSRFWKRYVRRHGAPFQLDL